MTEPTTAPRPVLAVDDPGDPGLLFIEQVAELAGVEVPSIRIAVTRARAKRRLLAAGDPAAKPMTAADIPDADPADACDRWRPAAGHPRLAQNCPRWKRPAVEAWIAAKRSWPASRKDGA